MPLGPVFAAELLTTSRRARYYVARVVYGLILLWVLWQTYTSYFPRWGQGRGEASIRQMADFAGATFGAFLACQSVAVLLLTPAIIAGAIADERQRKTLHYLLASRLSSGQIVLGKLAARLLLLSVFLAIGLPVMSLLGLFGGIEPRQLAWAYAGTSSTILLLAGLSLFVSVGARRVRDALIVAFVLEGLWLGLPPFVAHVISRGWPVIYSAIGPVNDAIYATSPAILLESAGRGALGGGALAFEAVLLRMVALQVGLAIVFLGLAVWRLRPSFRNEGARPRRPGRRSQRLLVASSGPPDDEPMLWKERRVARLKGPARWVVGAAGVLLASGVGYGVWEYFGPALEDFLNEPTGVPRTYDDRDHFNGFLKVMGGLLYVAAGVAVAAAAAGSVTSEREEDTWTSLTTTRLTGREILGAKALGAVWGARGLVLVLLLTWLAGLIAGALHPFGALLGALDVGANLAFVAVLGVCLSVKMRTTSRAIALTIGLLMVLHGGYLIALIGAGPGTMTMLIASGISPLTVGMSLVSYRDVWQALGWLEDPYWGIPSHDEAREALGTIAMNALLYGVGAVALFAWASRRFDNWIDRPTEAGRPAAPPVRAPSEEVPA